MYLKCCLVCVALLLIFHLDTTCIVLLLCYRIDVSLEFLTIYQQFCFVPLVSRFHWKVQCLFCIFCFQKIFDGLRIMTWTWSHWCRSKFYFYNSLSSMLYLPFTKYYDWDTYCLRGSWVCLYSYMFWVHVLSWRLWLCHCLVMYVDFWFHVWHATVAAFHIVSVEDFRKFMVRWKVFVY